MGGKLILKADKPISKLSKSVGIILNMDLRHEASESEEETAAV
jgi:hypothetical protein